MTHSGRNPLYDPVGKFVFRICGIENLSVITDCHFHAFPAFRILRRHTDTGISDPGKEDLLDQFFKGQADPVSGAGGDRILHTVLVDLCARAREVLLFSFYFKFSWGYSIYIVYDESNQLL